MTSNASYPPLCPSSPSHPVQSKSPAPPTSNSPTKHNPHEVTFAGTTYREVMLHNIVYWTSQHRSVRKGALVDLGANGGIAGDNVHVTMTGSHPQVDVQGINNHQLVNIPLATVGGVLLTQKGPIIGIFNQFAYTGKGRTILSSRQMEHLKQQVDDQAKKVGGTQTITTLEGYVIPH